MPTRTETDRYKWPDDELHLIRVEPVAFRGSAHAPEPAVEPAGEPLTNRETPEAVEPPDRVEIGAPEAVEPPEAREAIAPEAVEPPEAREAIAPEAVEPPERAELGAPEPVESPASAGAPIAPEVIDLFALARAKINPLREQVRR